MSRPLDASLLLAVAGCVTIALATRDTTAVELALDRGAEPSTLGVPTADLAPVETRRSRAPSERSAASATPRPAGPLHDQVRLHGRVVRNGVPVPGFDLSFVNAARREADWDFTDAEGSFEVRVPPGTYEVRHDERGAAVATVAVPGHEVEQRLEVALSQR